MHKKYVLSSASIYQLERLQDKSSKVNKAGQARAKYGALALVLVKSCSLQW